MIKLVETVRELAPHCNPLYLESLELNGSLLEAKGLTASALRAAHWLAQGLEETGGGTIIRESGDYRAARIVEIFGPGHSSAAIGEAEAAGLAHDGPALFDRAYGLGNPHLARELGNTKVGDGWAFRGNCWYQTTGREHHHLFGDQFGISFEANPEAMAQPKFAVGPAILEWARGDWNRFADANDIRSITRALNGGFNGYAERVAWFEKTYALLRRVDEHTDAWVQASPLPSTTQLQTALNQLGFRPALKVDGRYGPATHAAVAWFQEIAGVKIDGAAGPITLAAIASRLNVHPTASAAALEA